LRSVGVGAHWARAVASALGVCISAGIHPAGKVRSGKVELQHTVAEICVIVHCEMLLLMMMMMLILLLVVCRPSDSDIVDSVGDDDSGIVTKPSLTSVSQDGKHVASCSLPQVVRTLPTPSVELVNEKSTPAVNISSYFALLYYYLGQFSLPPRYANQGTTEIAALEYVAPSECSSA